MSKANKSIDFMWIPEQFLILPAHAKPGITKKCQNAKKQKQSSMFSEHTLTFPGLTVCVCIFKCFSKMFTTLKYLSL